MVALSASSGSSLLGACTASLLAAASAGAFQALWNRNWFRRQVLDPSEGLIEQARRACLGQQLGRSAVPEESPLARLAQLFDEALLGMDERTKASMASYTSLESAFEQIHSVLHSMGEGVIVEDSRSGVVLINPIARVILGLADDEKVEGRPMAELFPLEVRHQVSDVIAERWHTGIPAGANGVRFNDRVIDLSIAPVHEARKHDASGSVMVLLDVTRSHEVQRLKDDFLRSVSHELLTPLTSIRSFTEILRDMTPADEATWREFVCIVNAESDRLMRLVSDVLDLAQLDAGRMELSIQPLQVEDVFQTISVAFEPVACERKIRFEMEVGEGVDGIRADLPRMNQILNNLVGNAFKFTPDGGQIRVRALSEGEQVRISVDDSGPGIPKEKQHEVFERFNQIGPTLTDKPKGTGLGLVLCRELLKCMGGKIWLETSEFGGARMVFELPACSQSLTAWLSGSAMSPQEEQLRAARHAAGAPRIEVGRS